MEQGAANTVWAAVAREWEGRGGRYLEEFADGLPYDEADTTWGAPGYAPYAYDQAAAARLWDASFPLVGLQQ